MWPVNYAVFPQQRWRPCDLRALYRSDGFLIEALFWTLEHFCLAWLWVSCMNLDKTFNNCAAVVLCTLQSCEQVKAESFRRTLWEGYFGFFWNSQTGNVWNLLVRGGDDGAQGGGSCSWGSVVSLVQAAMLNTEGGSLDSVLRLTSPSVSSLSNPHCYGFFVLIFSIFKLEKKYNKSTFSWSVPFLC